MVFKNLCVFVLWTKVASALEGLLSHIPPNVEVVPKVPKVEPPMPVVPRLEVPSPPPAPNPAVDVPRVLVPRPKPVDEVVPNPVPKPVEGVVPKPPKPAQQKTYVYKEHSCCVI